MESVSILKSHNAWDRFFIEEPLTLEEFVYTSPTLPKYIFPFIMDEIKSLSKNPVSEIYMQTCVGVGKSTLSAIITAYTIYLFCITKDPNKLWGFPPSCTFSYGILGTRKTAELAIHSLITVLEQIPMFNKTRSHNDAKGPICYNTGKSNKLLEVYSVSANGAMGVPLYLIPVQSPADIIGTNLVGATLSEIQMFMEVTKTEPQYVFTLIQKIKCRLYSRFGPRDVFIHRLFVDKDPYDVEDDVIDNYIHSDSTKNNSDIKVITLAPRWELFPNDFNMNEYLYIDLYTEEVLTNPNANTLKIPAFLKNEAMLNPKNFIRSYIGLPTSIIENPKRAELKKLHKDLISANVKIIMDNGIFYLKDRNSDTTICITDLFS